MMKKFFQNGFLLNVSPSRSVMSAAFVITILGLMSRLLGLLRDRFLASTFGAGDTLDVYYAAFRIPDLIYNFLILGALSAAFIPVFTGLMSREKEGEAWELARGIMNLAIVCILALSVILFIFAPQLLHLITPGFSPEKIDQAVIFTRIMFLSPLFLGISGIFGGILTSMKHFLIYSVAPLFYNLGIIIGVVFLVRFLGPIGLAWGVVLGAFLHMAFQYPAARHLGYRHQWDMWRSLHSPQVRRVLKLMVPRTLGIAVNQVNLLIITVFASLLVSGSLAIFNLAQNLQGVPIGLIGSSFAIAIFPTLAALHAKDDREGFVTHFSEAFRQILFFIVPISVFVLLLRAQIVRLVLGAGKFDWSDTQLTFGCLGIFTLSLFAQSLAPLLARSFYSMHDTKTPFYVALVSEAVNISLVVFFLNFFQDGQQLGLHFGSLTATYTFYKVYGLAIAFSVSSIVQFLILLFMLRSRFESLDDHRLVRSLTRIALATVLAGIVVQIGKFLIAGIYGEIDTFLRLAVQLMVAGTAGAIVFVLACQVLKVEEFLAFKQALTRRIWRTKTDLVEGTEEVSGIL